MSTVFDEARERALSYLERRGLTGQELRVKLHRAGYKREVIAQVISELNASGLLNDEEYARQWVERRLSMGYGPYRVRAELEQKGVPIGIIYRALEEVSSEREREIAIAFARKKMAQRPEITYQQLAAALERRGYRPSIIVAVLGELFSQT